MWLLKKLTKLCNRRGQALTESAIILPVMMVVGLGTWQLILLQHARVLVEYAGHNACRAGIVHNGDPGYMQAGALASVLPIYGDTHDFPHLMETWVKVVGMVAIGNLIDGAVADVGEAVRDAIGVNLEGFVPQTSMINVSVLSPREEYFPDKAAEELDFDAVTVLSEFAHLLSAEVTVLVPLRIPLVNKMIWQLYVARYALGDSLSFKSDEPINGLGVQVVYGTQVVVDGEVKDLNEVASSANVNALQVRNNLQLEMIKGLAAFGVYVIPIKTTCGMQMQSNFYKKFANYGVFDVNILRK